MSILCIIFIFLLLNIFIFHKACNSSCSFNNTNSRAMTNEDTGSRQHCHGRTLAAFAKSSAYRALMSSIIWVSDVADLIIWHMGSCIDHCLSLQLIISTRPKKCWLISAARLVPHSRSRHTSLSGNDRALARTSTHLALGTTLVPFFNTNGKLSTYAFSKVY